MNKEITLEDQEVVFINEETGEEVTYVEVETFEFKGEQYAVLVEKPSATCEPGCKCHEDPMYTIAHMEPTADGDVEYTFPESDEEYEEIVEAYFALVEEDEE